MSPRMRAGGDPGGPPRSGAPASSWAAYLDRQLDARGWDNATLARAANIDRSLIGRWRNGETRRGPTIDSVRAVARALDCGVKEAVVAAGLLTEDELDAAAPSAPDLRLVDDEELLDEVRRRMAARRRAVQATEGGDEVTDVAEQSGVDVGETEEERERPGPTRRKSRAGAEASPWPRSAARG